MTVGPNIPTRAALRAGAVACMIALSGAPAVAENAGAGPDPLLSGQFNLDVRYRFELVDQVGISPDARAHTVRTRLGYETGSFWNTTVLVEGEWLTGLGPKRYNDTVEGDARFPVVADPDNIEANRYVLTNTGIRDTTLKFGRQRITLDNHRFIGNVGFRQNEQTFDSARVTTGLVPGVSVDYGYIVLVNRIFGEDSPVGDFETNSHFFRLASDALGVGTLIGYGQLLDFDEVPALSSKTFGLRWTGAEPIGGPWTLHYTAEAAWQSDHANNPNSDSFAYYFIEPGVSHDAMAARVGYEVLTGNGRRAFQTPLATLHAFQGWADKFLTTPGGGIQDLYLKLTYTVAGPQWLAGTQLTGVYHRFWAEEDGQHYGDEFDAEISRTLFDHLTLALTYAAYRADTLFTGTDKFWATVNVKF